MIYFDNKSSNVRSSAYWPSVAEGALGKSACDKEAVAGIES